MATKRRDFHDLGDDDEDDQQHGSATAQEDSRFKAFPSKRRRIEDVEATAASEDSQSEDEEEPEPEIAASEKAVQVKPLTPAQLEASRRKAKKTGVIYISRVPPFMKPSTLRNLLTPLGDIERIFLTPEAAPSYTRRVRSGGNKKRSFLDGWIEFASKKKAKACVELLNGNIIGGKKNGFYHDDLWNLKYLKGFKWSDLMEQVQAEEKMQEGQMRAELLQDARERKTFLDNLERTKKDRGMKTKREMKARMKDGQAGGSDKAKEMAPAERMRQRFDRHFEHDRRTKDRDNDRSKSDDTHLKGLQEFLF